MAFLTGHLCRLQKKHSPLPHGSILITRRFRCTRFSRDCIKSRRVDCQGLYRFRGCKGLAARTAALQGQGRFSGRDGLRAVPFFSLLLGQLNLWDGTKPVPPAVSREDHWSFDQDLEGVRSLWELATTFQYSHRGARRHDKASRKSLLNAYSIG